MVLREKTESELYCEIKEAFQIFDRDNDGIITKEEEQTILRMFGINPNEKEDKNTKKDEKKGKEGEQNEDEDNADENEDAKADEEEKEKEQKIETVEFNEFFDNIAYSFYKDGYLTDKLHLKCVLEHDEGVGLEVEGELLLGLDLLLLRSDGLGIVVVLGIGLACEHGLRGQLLQTEARQVDIGLLGLSAGVAELDIKLAGLDIQDDALALEVTAFLLFGQSLPTGCRIGIVDGHTVTIVILA